jgi:hypothetical protein
MSEVYKAISAVTEELSKIGISKAKQNTQQNYKFRGIDDVYGALSPIIARQGLCILPRVMERSVTEQESRNGGKLFYTVLKVEFDLVSSKDGSSHTICTIGEAMDSGDKSSNKAMSAAYKYACFQAFCIPTEGDQDADSQSHEVAGNLQAKGLADRFREALRSEIDGKVFEIHDKANADQELYGAAWRLLSAAERREIKAAVERVRVPNTNRPERANA